MLLKYFLILIVSTQCCSTQHLAEIRLIKNYIKKQNNINGVDFYTCWAKHEINFFLKGLNRIRVMTDFTKIQSNKLSEFSLIVSDSNCPNFELLLKNAEESSLFRAPLRWLILDNNNVYLNFSILIDSNFAVAKKISQQTFSLKLIHKKAEDDKTMEENDLAVFHDNKFEYFNQFSAIKNRSLKGVTITVSYVRTNPNYPLDITSYRNRHIDTVTKASYILVFTLLEILNCTMSFIERDSWGYKQPNNSYYDGMFGDIQNGTAEIAGTSSFFTIDRLHFTEYLAVDTFSNVRFILKNPPLSYVQNLFVLPFQKNVWYWLFGTILITLLILYIIIIWENKHEERLSKASNIDNVKSDFFGVVMLQIGAVTQQGSDAEPKSYSGRIAFFIIVLILMFLYTAYSAYIVVLLQSSSNSIKSYKDLLNSKISLGVEDIIYSKPYFENVQEPIRKSIYRKKIAPKGQKPNYFSVTEGIAKVRKEFFGFHVEKSPGYKVIMDTFKEHEKCGLVEIDYFYMFNPSLAIRKHSAYRIFFKTGFRQIYESGVRHRHMNRLYYKKPQCTSSSSTFVQVGFIEAYFPLTIFCVGLVLAVFGVIFEILVDKYLRKFTKSYSRK